MLQIVIVNDESDDLQTREQMLLDLERRPARLWHNLWRVRVPYEGMPAGNEYFDCDKWPTREIAEEKAREELAWDAAHGDALVEEWVGAFPVEHGPT